MPMRRSFIILAALGLTGCLGDSPEELDRLVKEDSAFKTMIVARDEAQHQVQIIKRDLLSKKKTVDAQVGKLRGEYDAYAKAQSAKIAQYRQSIEANRDQIKKELELAGASLEAKTAELSGYQRTLTDVKKVLTEGKGLSLSKSERQKWEERILLLSEKMRPLTEEIQDLRLKIRLKRQKMGYLR